VRRIRPLNAERHAHGRRHANRRRAANHHVLDRRRDLAIVGIDVVNHFSGQAALVEYDTPLLVHSMGCATFMMLEDFLR